MSVHCALCGRLTLQPAAWIGIYPVGPKCARKAGLAQFARVRRPQVAHPGGERVRRAQRDARTRDLFEGAP